MARVPFNPRKFGSPPPGMPSQTTPDQVDQNAQFRSLDASLLYCPTCREATPARERLLLVLPSGNKYEYMCSYCGTSTGEKTDQNQQNTQIFIP